MEMKGKERGEERRENKRRKGQRREAPFPYLLAPDEEKESSPLADHYVHTSGRRTSCRRPEGAEANQPVERGCRLVPGAGAAVARVTGNFWLIPSPALSLPCVDAGEADLVFVVMLLLVLLPS